MKTTTSAPIALPDEIQTAIDAGAVIVLSMSGGKDSQAMALAVVRHIVDNELPNEVRAVHADLGRAEWFDTLETVKAQVESVGLELDARESVEPRFLELDVVSRPQGDLLDRIQQRATDVGDAKPFWPSAAARYCTGEMKRNQIDKFLRTLGPLVISVEGLRREESTARARKDCWEPRKQITNSKREALTWRPINEWTLADVWTEIGGPDTLAALEHLRRSYADGFEDHALEAWSLVAPNAHDAYVRGNDRLSCSLCVLATRSDIENGARHNPEYFAALVALEERYGWTFKQDLSLVELAKELQAEAEELAAAVTDDPTDGVPAYQLIGLEEEEAYEPTPEELEAEYLSEVYAEAGSGARSLGFDSESCYQAANEAVARARGRNREDATTLDALAILEARGRMSLDELRLQLGADYWPLHARLEAAGCRIETALYNTGHVVHFPEGA